MPSGIFRFLKTAVAAAVAGCMLLIATVLGAFRLKDATYYLYSASSAAKRADTLSLADLPNVTGESAVYSLEELGLGGLEEEEIAKKISNRFRAEVLFTERIGDSVSYYCYSPFLKGGVNLSGVTVNLHVAVKRESVGVGIPIIFGGY